MLLEGLKMALNSILNRYIMPNKKCPFQIIDTIRNDSIDTTWIALKKNITDECYLSIEPFHKEWRRHELIKFKDFTHFDGGWIKRLFRQSPSRYVQSAPINKKEKDPNFYDVIRNPTTEELNFIKLVLKRNGYRYNVKLDRLEKIEC